MARGAKTPPPHTHTPTPLAQATHQSATQPRPATRHKRLHAKEEQAAPRDEQRCARMCTHTRTRIDCRHMCSHAFEGLTLTSPCGASRCSLERCDPSSTVWPSGLRRWLQAPVRKGVGSNPTAVSLRSRGWARCGATRPRGEWGGTWDAVSRHWAHGVVVSRPLRMRKALGSIPSGSIFCRLAADRGACSWPGWSQHAPA
jgi:hypothetical protein